MKYTKKEHEKYLNEIYSQSNPDDLFDSFIYLTVRSRGKHIQKKNLTKHINKNTLGFVIRRYDPIAFEVSYGDMCRQY